MNVQSVGEQGAVISPTDKRGRGEPQRKTSEITLGRRESAQHVAERDWREAIPVVSSLQALQNQISSYTWLIRRRLLSARCAYVS